MIDMIFVQINNIHNLIPYIGLIILGIWGVNRKKPVKMLAISNILIGSVGFLNGKVFVFDIPILFIIGSVLFLLWSFALSYFFLITFAYEHNYFKKLLRFMEISLIVSIFLVIFNNRTIIQGIELDLPVLIIIGIVYILPIFISIQNITELKIHYQQRQNNDFLTNVTIGIFFLSFSIAFIAFERDFALFFHLFLIIGTIIIYITEYRYPNFFEEINEKIRFFKKIKKYSDQYEYLVDSSKDVIVKIDKDFNIIYSNEAANELKENIKFKENQNLQYWLKEKYRKSFQNKIKKIWESKETIEMNYPLLTNNNHEIYMSIKATPIIINNKISSLALMMRDITLKKKTFKKLEEKITERTSKLSQAINRLKNQVHEKNQITNALENVISELEKTNKIKSDFIANMSHDLRTPLNSILGFTQVLIDGLEGELSKEHKIMIEDVRENGKSLLSFINQILDLEKIKSNSFSIDKENFDVKELILTVIKNFRHLIEDKRLNLELNLKTIMINADRLKIKEVISCLLENAIKFTREGKITIIIKDIKSDNTFLFSIKDTGIGIKEKTKEKIFQPFTQLEDIWAKEFQGSGIGLFYVKNIIEYHAGEVWFESKYGQGSEFFFSLPF